MSRKTLLVPLISCLLLTVAPSARADIFTGTCVLNVEFGFSEPVRSASSIISQGSERSAPPSYSFSLHGAADLDPTHLGVQACVVDNDPLNPFKGTSGSGDGNAVTWLCEAAVGSGFYTQTFDPDPDGVVGRHAIVGTWNDWTMVVFNETLNFTGSIHLTVAPSDATKLAQCETTGIDSLRMTGVMHFQDPPIPAV